MTMNCELVPRPDASADNLKRLGDTLKAWFEGFLKQHVEVDGWLDQGAIDDLLAGELPKPFVLRCLRDHPHGMRSRNLTDALEEARAEHPLLNRSLPPAHARSVPFGVSIGVEAQDDLLGSLRSAVPMDVVAEVRINGRMAWRSRTGSEG